MKNKTYIVISGAPGVGKSSLLKCIREERPELLFSVSVTDREPRPEENEDSYEFVSTATFEECIRKETLLEWVREGGVYYGTRKSALENLCAGDRILLDLDTKGGIAVKRAYPDETALIFISAPPEVIEKRLRDREEGRMDSAVINARLARIKTEFERALSRYDYIVENIELGVCLENILNIIDNA